MSFIQDVVHGLGTGPNLRDWRHANQIFVGNNYALAPKYSYLFHVAFDINTAAGVSRLSNQEMLEMGLLVKSVQIPKYTIETKTMNAYNRPNIVQQKIKYDPISISFHDDSSDVVRLFWYDYMSHFYRDTDYSETIYNQSHKYNKPPENYWGYQPAKYETSGTPERTLNAIRIYSLHRKRFTEYVLINPMITGFQHGQHQQGQSEFLENTMTVGYETVLYNYGSIKTDGEPKGFAMLNYDNTPSPLSPQGGGTNSLLGPGGALSAVQGISQSLASGSGLGIAAAGITGLRAFNNLKGQNILGMAGTELKTIASGILSGDTNTLNRLSIPKASSGNGTLSQQSTIQE
jgi:hypothetical protein